MNFLAASEALFPWRKVRFSLQMHFYCPIFHFVGAPRSVSTNRKTQYRVIPAYKKTLCNLQGCIGSYSFFSIVLKRVFIQLFKIKKLCQCHIECQCDLVKCFYTRILCQTTNDIIQSRLLNITHCSKFIDRNATLFAQLANSFYIKLRILHKYRPRVIITRLWVNMMITTETDRLTRIRVDSENILALK